MFAERGRTLGGRAEVREKPFARRDDTLTHVGVVPAIDRFSIVVPTRGRPEALRESLVALGQLDYPHTHYEVIVVEDGADPRTARVIEAARQADVELKYEVQPPRGAASARNRGAALASGDLVLFCDDDIVVESSHLRLHLAARESIGDAIIGGAWEFSPRVLAELRSSPFGRFRIELERKFAQDAMGESIGEGRRRVTGLPSTNLALRRDLFWEVGGFDEQFPVAGAEDQDFSLRAAASGCTFVLDTNIRCLHNDARLDLRSYCAREERSAQTMPYLFYSHPAEHRYLPYVRENRPLTRDDPPSLAIKKVIKGLLASPPAIATIHRIAELLESAGAPERLLRRVYTGLFGLHLYRGFRTGWRKLPKTSVPSSEPI